MTIKARPYPPMTLSAFKRWFKSRSGRVVVGGTVLPRAAAIVVPCACGDINCRGWRFVERSA